MLKGMNLVFMCACLAILAGCGVEDVKDNSEESAVRQTAKALFEEVSSGHQTDLNPKRFDVFNDEQQFIDFTSLMPSMTGGVPEFDDQTETMIALILDSQSCSFLPKIIDVIESADTITIEVLDVKEPSPETCNPNFGLGTLYKFVVISKVDKPVSLLHRKEI